MSSDKKKNFSFRAVAFSGKLFSVIAATMLLLLVDGGINNSANAQATGLSLDPSSLNVNVNTVTAPASQTQQTQQYPATLESHHQRLQALSEKAGLKMDPNGFAMSLESHRQRIDYLERMAGIKTIDRLDNISLHSQHQRLEALEQAFANNPPATQQTSGTQDLINNGINPTETPYPMSVCNALVNGQNLCTEQRVTAVVAALAVGLIGGIITLVTTEINNQKNTDKQRENSNNLLTLLLLSQQKQQCVPSLSNNYTCP